MSLDKEQLTKLLYRVIVEFNSERDSNQQISTQPETALFGINSSLDSMDLVHVVVGFEQALADAGYAVSLADERAMSQRNSPFATVGSLVTYAQRLLDEQAGRG